MTTSAARITALVLLTGAAVPAHAQQNSPSLRGPEAFSFIQDTHRRSVALFGEAGKVIQHPRCINCHPAGERPLQGNDEHVHYPAVVRGPEDMGAPGAYCTGCHRDRNVTLLGAPETSVPGNPRWQLAPLEMAWQGKTLGEICRQIKDSDRNGHRTLAELREHMADDDLVGWGWHPGPGRQPAPGTQKLFGELIEAWIETGAACP